MLRQLSGSIRVNEQQQIMDRYNEAKLDDIGGISINIK